MNVQEIPISKIQVVENSRINIKNLEGLMQDIKQHGLKQAIGVIPTKGGEFVLVFGHRRLSACQKLGWKKIPTSIFSEDMSVADIRINNLAENIHREDILPIELGRICHQLKTDMGLSTSEIAAKLSINKTRIDRALDMFNQMPTKHRNRVAYITGTTSKNGNIPASVAHKIISCKRQYGLSEAGIEKLFAVAKSEELTGGQLKIISLFLDQGLSVSEAIKAGELNEFQRFDVIVNNEDVEKHLEKNKMDSRQKLLEAIVYGEAEPLKRPDFLKRK